MNSTRTYPGGTSKLHEYRGVTIEEMWYGRWPFQFSIYPMFRAAGRENEVGGGGGWTAATLKEAHAQIDGFLTRLGLESVPAPQEWKPPAGSDKVSLSAGQLASRIKTVQDAMTLAGAINNPAVQVFSGDCLLSWKAESISGCIRFGRFDDEGTLHAQVAVVNAPESQRSEYQSGSYPVPTTLLMVG